MKKPFTLTADKEDLDIIDKGAKLTRRSRTNFVITSAVEKAREVVTK